MQPESQHSSSAFPLAPPRAVSLHARGVLVILAASAVLSAITANECHMHFTLRASNTPASPSIAFGVVMWFWWGCLALAMWRLNQRNPLVLTFTTKTVLAQICAGSMLCFLHLELIQKTLQAGFYWPAWREAYASLNYVSLPRFGADLVVYGFVFGISGFLHMQSQRQLQAMQTLELEKQLSQAQLQALQMQMEPHFLFNTLNAVTSLVAQGRNPEAMETLPHLNTILRNTLKRRAPVKVSFVEELRLIESYLAIQQVRFADRLEVSIETTPEVLACMVPSFLLQPIVENAIQHGIAPMESGGRIETQVKRVGDTLWMQVRDNGAGVGAGTGSLHKGHGIGIQSTRDRLALFYPGRHEFAAAPLAAGGFEVTIQIPYEQAAA